MKWIESIQLRSADRNRQLLESKLQRLIDEVYRKRKRKVVMAYSRVLVDTDFCIHILHDSQKVETGGSRLALHLVAALKEFGLVHYSIWREMNSK